GAHSTVVHGCAMAHTAEALPPRCPSNTRLAHERSPRYACLRSGRRTGQCSHAHTDAARLDCPRLGLGCQARLGHGASRPIPRSRSLRSVVGQAAFYCGLCAAGTRWRAARPPSETPGFLLHAWRDVVLSPTPPGNRRRLPVAATFVSLLQRQRKVIFGRCDARAARAALPIASDGSPPCDGLP